MLFKTRSAAVYGIDAHLIDVEVDFLGVAEKQESFSVVGLPDAKYGEVVGAWVVPRPGADPPITEQAIRDYCRGRIAHFKIPKYLMIVESLPRTVTGKIRKHVLKDNAIGELGLGEAARIETA